MNYSLVINLDHFPFEKLIFFKSDLYSSYQSYPAFNYL